jgi:hypothetical protein
MKTRYSSYYRIGYYKTLNDPYLYNPCLKLNRSQKKNKVTNRKHLQEFVEDVNYMILKNLKIKKKSSPIITCKTTIKDNIHEFLKTKFSLTGRYKKNQEFLSFFKFKTKRYSNNNNLCFFTGDSFYVKICKGKQLNYLNEKLKCSVVKSKPFFSFRFLRLDIVV